MHPASSRCPAAGGLRAGLPARQLMGPGRSRSHKLGLVRRSGKRSAGHRRVATLPAGRQRRPGPAGPTQRNSGLSYFSFSMSSLVNTCPKGSVKGCNAGIDFNKCADISSYKGMLARMLALK